MRWLVRWCGGFAFIAVVGICGCSTFPSPLVVGDTYTNFEYEYSLDLPRGWERADDQSEKLERNARWVDEDMASLVLTNNVTQGIIAVLNQKIRLPYPRFVELDERYWEERINAMRKLLEAEVEVLSYDYRIQRDHLVQTQQNYFTNQRVFRPENVFWVNTRISESTDKKQIAFEWFLYPCQKNRSCQTIVILACPEDQYDLNRPAFEHIVATLRGHDFYN